MLRTHIVRKDERALLLYRGDFMDILEPGAYRYLDPLKRYDVERFSMNKPLFEHRLADYLVKHEPARVAQHFKLVELGANEIGLRYENGVLVEVLPPAARRMYWKGVIEVRVDRVDVSAHPRVDDALVNRLIEFSGSGLRARLPGAGEVFGVQVPQYHLGVLYVNGRLTETLAPGLHAFWRAGRDLRGEFVDLRQQVIEVSGQEILTRDKVSLRVNLSAGYRIVDVLLAHSKQAKPAEYLYRELQYALRAAVGTRTLDELLENKHHIDQAVMSHARAAVKDIGMVMESAGVKDIILPGEMKTLLGRVVEAEKAAQANVIRRREETAATRSLLNTAKVMEDNPVALRLKELETLERVTEKIDRISVFGGLEGVLQGLVKIQP